MGALGEGDLPYHTPQPQLSEGRVHQVLGGVQGVRGDDLPGLQDPDYEGH